MTSASDEVKKLSDWLFGGSKDNYEDARQRFNKMGDLRYSSAWPLWDDTAQAKRGDLVIYCDYTTRFGAVDADSVRHDTANAIKMTQADWEKYEVKDAVLGVCENTPEVEDGNAIRATAITMGRNMMATALQRDNEGHTNSFDDSPSTALMVKNWAAKGDDFWRLLGKKEGDIDRPSIDAVKYLLDSVLFHEFGHSYYCGDAEDTWGESSYGWGAVMQIRNPHNSGMSMNTCQTRWYCSQSQ